VLKRSVDVVVSFVGLVITSPILLFFAFAVWLEDRQPPFYFADRVGLAGKTFKMAKLRSMVVQAEKSGVTSTSDADDRITKIGRLIRKYKLDEVTQFWNVLKGDMSLVGPRPNVAKWGVDLYTSEEMRLLSVLPGITDFSSVVFADEGLILKVEEDPDLAYNQLIRPWKSRLSLIYVDHRSFRLDVKLLFITIISIVSRPKALTQIERELVRLDASKRVVEVASRKTDLMPSPPPGSEKIVTW
jgi:lipopolysaccharide/colanic/teichoic acid biosynthesis glycosyltransferase